MTNDTVKNRAKIPTILVIDDDLLLLKAYGIKCRQQGWNAVLLSEGAQAVAYLSQAPPDAVLLDLLLPGTSGFQLLEDMRRNDQWKDVPVLVLTNLKEKDARTRAEKLGVVEYLVKTENGIDGIVQKIKNILKPV